MYWLLPASSILVIFGTRTSSIIYKDYIEMREVMAQPGQWLLTTIKKEGKLDRNENVSLF
jgi:hypothetical protein